MRGVGGVRKSMHQSWLAKRLGSGFLCWGFKGVQEEIPREEASTLQIGPVAFPVRQYSCPQLPACHWLFDKDGHQDNSSNLAPCDFCLFPKLRGYPYEIIEEIKKGCDEDHWHTYTRGLPLALPEIVGTAQQVHYSWRSLLRRGIEFHVCTIYKSVHTKKDWKLY